MMNIERTETQVWQPDPDVIPPEVLADLERAVQLAMSGQHDPEFERRIQLQSAKIRQEVLQKNGVLDVAVDLVREGREEE
jgi:hypothetical protein